MVHTLKKDQQPCSPGFWIWRLGCAWLINNQLFAGICLTSGWDSDNCFFFVFSSTSLLQLISLYRWSMFRVPDIHTSWTTKISLTLDPLAWNHFHIFKSSSNPTTMKTIWTSEKCQFFSPKVELKGRVDRWQVYRPGKPTISVETHHFIAG